MAKKRKYIDDPLLIKLCDCCSGRLSSDDFHIYRVEALKRAADLLEDMFNLNLYKSFIERCGLGCTAIKKELFGKE